MQQVISASSKNFARGKERRQLRYLPTENDIHALVGNHDVMIKSNKKTSLPVVSDLHIGAWIRFLGRKPTEIAKNAKINEGYLSQLISGEKQNPSYDMIRRIADELKIGIDQLRRPPPDEKTVELVRSLDPAIIERIQRDRFDPST